MYNQNQSSRQPSDGRHGNRPNNDEHNDSELDDNQSEDNMSSAKNANQSVSTNNTRVTIFDRSTPESKIAKRNKPILAKALHQMMYQELISDSNIKPRFKKNVYVNGFYRAVAVGVSSAEFLKDRVEKMPPPWNGARLEVVYRGMANNKEDYEEPRRANVEARRADLEPRRANVESRRANVEPRRANVEPRRANVEPRRANVEPRRANLEQRRAKVEPSRANLEPRRANVDQWRVNEQPRRDNLEPRRANVELWRDNVEPKRDNVEQNRNNMYHQNRDKIQNQANFQQQRNNNEAYFNVEAYVPGQLISTEYLFNFIRQFESTISTSKWREYKVRPHGQGHVFTFNIDGNSYRQLDALNGFIPYFNSGIEFRVVKDEYL